MIEPMRKIVISFMHQAQSEQAKRNHQRRSHPRKIGRKLVCSKCGAKLHVGDVAYRTSRKYLCESCGKNVEI